ncbi:MAG: cob(I)yrinic acid a,c-diamide adenosyltransferase [Lachnospiraceae bacterium]|nr:cob(I)yrinic acid a,c-diamide adenosyltransferase [Lachnospiraceae bacterium]
MEKGIIQVYYGIGPGKTSAALGNSIRRAIGGETVYFIRFLKGQFDSEYLTRLEPEVKSFRFERSVNGFDTLNDEERQEEKANIINGLNFAKKALTTGECDVLVLDEILGAINEGVVSFEEVKEVLSQKGPFASVIMTGRELPEGIREMADQVLNIVPEKEPEEIDSV